MTDETPPDRSVTRARGARPWRLHPHFPGTVVDATGQAVAAADEAMAPLIIACVNALADGIPIAHAAAQDREIIRYAKRMGANCIDPALQFELMTDAAEARRADELIKASLRATTAELVGFIDEANARLPQIAVQLADAPHATFDPTAPRSREVDEQLAACARSLRDEPEV